MRASSLACTGTIQFLVCIAGCVPAAGAPVNVAIQPDVQYQTILGWGKSTPHLDVPDMLRDQVIVRAVDDLGLTRLRLEPPSGNRSKHRNWEWLNDNGDPGDIEWGAFATQELDLRASRWLVPFKRRVEANGDRFDLYVSPSFFDGGSSGTVPAWLLHSPGEYTEWASAVLLRLRDTHGVTADYYSICNEAGNNNAFTPDVVGRMIETLGPHLSALGLPTRIQFPEGVNAEVSWRYIEALRDQAPIWPHIGMISYHLYGKNEVRPQIRDFALERGLPTGQTEFMNLKMDHLYDDLLLGGVSYWEIYGLGGPEARNAGTYVDSSAFRGGPQYWNFRQVMHYVRPGAARVEAASTDPAVRPLAFVRDDRMAVVLINTAEPLEARTVTVGGMPPGQYGACQSVAGRPYEELGLRDVAADGALAVEVPANSVLTLYPHPGGNQPPTVTTWLVQPHYLTAPADAATLSATATDPELDPVSYAWSVVTQPDNADVTLTSPQAARTQAQGLSAPGEYVFELAVSDPAHTVTRQVMLTVFADNQPPTPLDVHNRIPVMVTLPQSTTELRAGAWDLEDDPLTYRWTTASQPPGAAVTLETPADQKCKVSNITVAGDHVFRLEVSDPTHTVAEDLKVPVYPENASPVIRAATADPATVVLPNQRASLSAAASDPDGDVISHWWSLRHAPAGAQPAFDRPGSAQTNVSGLTEVGTYVFAVTVVDRTKFATQDVSVSVVAEGAAEDAARQPAEPPAERSRDDRVILARGTLAGTVTAKGPAWIEVRSDTGKTERYIPPWRGGLPRDGGGPDQQVTAAIARVTVGERVKVEWYVNDHLRLQAVQPLPE